MCATQVEARRRTPAYDERARSRRPTAARCRRCAKPSAVSIPTTTGSGARGCALSVIRRASRSTSATTIGATHDAATTRQRRASAGDGTIARPAASGLRRRRPGRRPRAASSTATAVSAAAGTPSAPSSVSSSSRPARRRQSRVLVRRSSARASSRDLERDDGDVVLAAGAVRRLHERAARPRRGRRGSARRRSTIAVVADHVGEPVRAEQEDVARPRASTRERVDVDVGIGAERARDHRPLRVRLGLLAATACRARTSSATSEWSSVSCSSCSPRRRYARESPTWPNVDASVGSTSATVIVVPMPGRVGVLARALVDAAVRLLDQVDDALLAAAVRVALLAAPPRRAATRPRRPARRPSRRRSRRAAARTTYESSLRRRLRPVSVTACDRGRSSSLVPQVGLADADDVAGREPPRRASSRDAVDERAVRRADVLDPDAVAARLEARVARRRELVVRRAAMSFVRAAADRHGAESSSNVVALVERGALDHDEPARARPARAASARRPPPAAARG